jgi:cell wall-associated NlpC family hydrolase
MTRVPLHAPRAAPGAIALRTGARRRMGLALGLAWLVVGGAVGVVVAGAHQPAVALGPTSPQRPGPAGLVAASDLVADEHDTRPAMPADPMPHDPMAARSWPGALTTTVQMQPIPAFVGVDDPPGPGPAPAVDPAVAALLSELSNDAKGSPADPRPGPQALAALDFALAQVGRPYVWGATGPDSYDCSGLTWRSYSAAGIALPRVSADQHALGGTPVAIAGLLPGDLVFFATASWDPGAVHHVGMYVGRGLMVDAPHTGAYVRVEPVAPAGYVGAVRVVPERPGASVPARIPSPSATPTGTGPATGTVAPSDPPTPSATPTPAPSDTPTPTPSATDPPTDPPTDPATDPATDPPTDPPTDPATDPPTEPATDPPTDPAPDPGTDPPSAGTAPALG